MKLIYFIFIFIFICLQNLAFSNIDSILTKFQSSKSDSEKVQLLTNIAKAYNDKNIDSSIYYHYKVVTTSYNAYKKEKKLDKKLFFARMILQSLVARKVLFETKNDKYQSSLHNKLILKIANHLLKPFPNNIEAYAIMGDYYNYTARDYENKNKDTVLYYYKLANSYFQLPYKFDSLSNSYVDGLVVVNNNIATYYLDIGEYQKAIEHYYKALRIKEKQLFYSKSENKNSLKTLSSLYNNIANSQIVTNDFNEALNNYKKSLEIKRKIADSNGIFLVLGMIGAVYIQQKEYEKSIPLIDSAISYFKRKNNINILAKYYNNLGVCYACLYQFNKAIEAYEKSIEYYKQQKKVKSYGNIYNNIAGLYNRLYKKNKKNEYLNKAFEYAKKAEEHCKKYNILSIKDNLYNHMQHIYAEKNDYYNAFKYSLLYQSIKDSLFGDEKIKAIAEAKVQYETEKKQLIIDKLDKENKLKQVTLEKAQEEQKRQKTIIISIVIFLIIASISLVTISKMFVKIKQAHKILKKQKYELEEKNKLLNSAYNEIQIQKNEIEIQRDIVLSQKIHIEKIHKNTKESIEYANYIQKAVLRPLSNIIETNIPSRFAYDVLYKPKDIVSGDFYWSAYVNNYLIIAVSDCTGHGVPGALMSMLGISLLNEIVRKKEITKTSEVLEVLREEVIFSLQQKGKNNEQKDGMDIGIVAINCETLEMQFSGANNNLIYIPVDAKEPIEIKGDKMPVAIYEKMRSYTNHEIQLNKGDIFYLNSDGYRDQFGGKEKKKFLQKRFLTLLYNIKDLSMHKQNVILDKEISKWMQEGECEQTDDITVLGIKVL